MTRVEYDAIVVGRGGQGTKLATHIVAWAGALEGLSPLHYSIYDGLIRGGNIASTVVMSKDRPGVPIRSEFSVMVALSPGWFDRFYVLVEPGGHVYFDPKYVVPNRLVRNDVAHHPVDFSALAAEAGDARASNMVAAGVLSKHWGVPSQESLERAIPDIIPSHRQDRVEGNLAALRIGLTSMTADASRKEVGDAVS